MCDSVVSLIIFFQIFIKSTNFHGRDNNKRLYYCFKNDTHTGKIDNEEHVFIMEIELDKDMSEKVVEFIMKVTSKKNIIHRVSLKFDESMDKLIKYISNLKAKIEEKELIIEKAYEEYSLGNIHKDVYILKREIELNHIETINDEIVITEDKYKNMEREKEKSIKWIKDIFSAKKIEKLSSDLIHSLVEKIIVYGKHNFEIIFKFDMDSLIGGVKDE